MKCPRAAPGSLLRVARCSVQLPLIAAFALGPACLDGASEGSGSDPVAPQAHTARPSSEGARGPSASAGEKPDRDRPTDDPARAEKLADLDELCAAVDHDYKDGTLGDYYAKVEMRTRWGKAQRKAGDESIQPARLLEKAVQALDPKGVDPELSHCRVLLDYIDDVE